MADLNEHCRVVLGAIVPNRKDLLDRAVQHLSLDHFLDPTLKVIFQLTVSYYDLHSGIVTRGAVEDTLKRKLDVGRVAVYLEVFDDLLSRTPLDSDFSWSLDQIKDLAAERYTTEAITRGMEISRTGVELKGQKAPDGTNRFKGHEDARAYMLERFSTIDQQLHLQEAPENEVRGSERTFIEVYERRKAQKLAGILPGVMCGIPDIDNRTSGFQAGELSLVVAASTVGKSHLMVSLMQQAATLQKKNIVYLTTETVKSTIERRLIARHSVEDQFGLRDGLNSNLIKDGNLTPAEEEVYREVVHDLTCNPQYGRMLVAQMPEAPDMQTTIQKLYRIQRLFNIDLIIFDYLRLWGASRRRQSDREEINSVLLGAKNLAVSFDRGRGVPVVSPWQVNRTGQEKAADTGYYSNSAIAESAEAVNLTDIIITLLKPDENETRQTTLKAQISKNRDGERASGISIDVDYATSYFSQGRGFSSGGLGSNQPNGPMDQQDYSALLG